MSDFTFHTPETAPEGAKATLEKTQASLGRIPGLYAVMAEAPALLDGYLALNKLFSKQTSFTAEELTVVWQAINVEHDCTYCVPAHTFIAKAMKVDDAVSDALRDETPLPTARLEALRTFTLEVTRQRGHVSDEQAQAFLEAGFTRQNILEVVLGLSQKVMSNYVNHLARTPVDPVMEKFAWEKKG
ncbi:MAG: carboxymuconolactone decarboxylase family protein [Silicimonas sp.]|nr:carboxymuconolactone decarboxylase family protein [Silicimonas sp.]